MDLEKYSVTTDGTHVTYELLSEGPKGTIKKVVEYQKLESEEDEDVYNLAFGDWNEERKDFSDLARSNNSDMDKVLRTVASTAIDFIKHYPDASITLHGSTPARTRLYQMGILSNRKIISQLFDVQGFCEGSWQSLKSGKNYEAFMLKAKENL